ncbi:MAG: CPBP family intramembrane glutamic endopeptidase [Brumimicrobium sp.]
MLNLSALNLADKTFFAGFMEEFLFRGFLFGLLFRKLCRGFIPATLIGAVIFGFAHIYQGSSLLESTGIFLVTSIGAVWFAWLYIEWNNSLWVPIFLHILMNLSWALFDVSENAMGGLYVNIFRVITIALTVIITIRYNWVKGFSVNKGNLLLNNKN